MQRRKGMGMRARIGKWEKTISKQVKKEKNMRRGTQKRNTKRGTRIWRSWEMRNEKWKNGDARVDRAPNGTSSRSRSSRYSPRYHSKACHCQTFTFRIPSNTSYTCENTANHSAPSCFQKWHTTLAIEVSPQSAGHSRNLTRCIGPNWTVTAPPR